MEINEAMSFITSTQKFGSNLGLARMEHMLAKLGNPEKEIRAIHVAGTNGKGSTSSIIAEALMKHGLKVGLYTSPYIEFFNERIQINRENISDHDLALYTGLVKKVVEECLAEGMEHPTEFEVITTIMFLYFQEKKLDYCVIEVGLGGDKDSTNVVDPVISVITSISYDHMNVLGNTLEEIARAKAGIIKGAPTVSYPQLPEVDRVLRERAKETGSQLAFVEGDNVSFIRFNENQGTQRVHYRTPHWDFEAELRLLGLHQLRNSLLAVTVLDRLNEIDGIGLTQETMVAALGSVHWMGRLEIMHKDPLIIIDGAHNVDGITYLKRSLDFYYPHRAYVLILGILADKDIHQMAKTIAGDAAAIICVTPHSDRASLARDLFQYIESFNDHVSFEEDYESALTKALAKVGDDAYVICSGSLYMVGDLRRIIREKFGIQYEQ